MRQLEAELGIFQVGLGHGRLHDARLQQALVLGQCHVLNVERRRGTFVIVKEFDLALQVLLLFIQHKYFKAPAADREDIHTAVGVSLQNLFYSHSTTGIDNAFVPGQDDAEFGVLRECLTYHFLVTFLKNVQWQVRAWKDHHLQRKQREEPRGHATIIAFQADCGKSLTMNIDGKVVLITGASEGIGAACASVFRTRGARLSLTARCEEKLRAAGGPDALVTAGDLTNSETREAAVARTVQHFGSIDILINNAGMGLYAPAWETSLEDARSLFELNFFAPLAMVQLAAPYMRRQKSGTIINVSSVAGRVTLPWFTLYSASKYAMCSLTDGLRMELRKDGIQTITVCPGYVKTEFQKHARGGGPPPKIAKSKKFAITPEECAEAIARGVERGARTVMAPRSGWLFVLAERLFPSLVDAQLAAILHDV